MRGNKAWEAALKAMVPLVLAIGAWLVGVQVRLSSLEATRFTHQDGRDLEDRIDARMYPAWLREDLSEIKSMVRGLDERLRAVEQKVK